jgi:uncharacterized LabA/DUF88 family protein
MFGKRKVAVYIDGSNFYHYLKDKEINFPKGVKFDFKTFVDFLVRDRLCVSKRYYTGIFRNVDNSSKSLELVRGQQKFLSEIEKNGFIIKRGRIMYDSGKTREKGTDVKIATDMIVGAVDNIYDVAILVSSDTDLIPAIQYVRFRKKEVEYVGFSHAPSLGIQKHANLSKLLLPDEVRNFKLS